MEEKRYVSIVMDNNDGFIVTAFEKPEDAQKAVNRLNFIICGCEPDSDSGTEDCPYYVAGQDGEDRHRVYRDLVEWDGGEDENMLRERWEALHG